MKENTEGPTETPKEDAAKENPLAKELEAKKKENLDVTVGRERACENYHTMTDSLDRID